jgi:hypothetical protein
MGIVSVAKCRRDERILSTIKEAGLHAVELFKDSN